ncbi:hypothetical protein A0O36_01714 [Piscirickettsiaceae bacterium NZ-RLO1]|nr:hypothetical protein A0O36_01714 [Piscirickettsiaceae bacterium NZ-RLO1]
MPRNNARLKVQWNQRNCHSICAYELIFHTQGSMYANKLNIPLHTENLGITSEHIRCEPRSAKHGVSRPR